MPLHRLDAAFHRLGNVLLRHLLNRKQHDRHSLLLRQPIQRIEQPPAKLLAFKLLVRIIGSSGRRSAIRKIRGRLTFATAEDVIHRQCCRVFSSAPAVQRQIRHNPHQPAAEPLRILKRLEAGVCLEKRILRHLGRVMRVAKQPVRYCQGPALMPPDQLIERLSITGHGLFDELGIGHQRTGVVSGCRIVLHRFRHVRKTHVRAKGRLRQMRKPSKPIPSLRRVNGLVRHAGEMTCIPTSPVRSPEVASGWSSISPTGGNMLTCMSLRDRYNHFRNASTRGMRIALGTVLVVIVAMYVTWRFIEPAPPHRVVIAAGVEGGDYDYFAKKYAQYFKSNGFELKVKPTAGAVENWKLLLDPNSGVDVAIAQGGTAPETASDQLQAVCSLYYEPLWVFYRGERAITRLSELSGKRIAIGPEGSGVRALALKLLESNGIDSKNAGQTQLSEATGQDAAALLKNGQLDAVLLVIGPKSPVVQDLARSDGVRLMNFDQADAYARRFPYLSHITLDRGVLDLGRNIPAENVELIAPAAMLVTRKTAHHGTVELLVQATKATHSKATPLSDAGRFPSANLTDLPVGRDAEYYLRTPPSRLLGGLPFWLKSLVDRLVILLIPLAAVLLPLFRFAPALFRWSVRSRITRYYTRLHKIEEHLAQDAPPETLQEDLGHLRSLSSRLSTMTVPAGYMPDLYDLRANADRVRHRLRAHLAGLQRGTSRSS